MAQSPSRARLAQRLLIGFALTLSVIVLPIYSYKVFLKRDYTDFEVYYKAAARAKAGLWDQIYNLHDGASPFRYAPPLIPLFRPFAALSLPAARMLWFYLQYAWFVLGFFFIYRAMRAIFGSSARPERPAAWITAGAALFVLRFCLDCFTIGQISSLIFLALAFAFYAWVIRHPAWAALALVVPAALKIGPGFAFLTFVSARRWERRRGAWVAGLGIVLWIGFSAAWLVKWARVKLLWRAWLEIVRNDSVYYDASHYGSQSIKSALLRAAKWGWIGAGTAQTLYVTTAAATCLGLLLFWSFRRPRTLFGRGLFLALSLFPYLWFMPETFKYSLTVLAIPVSLLLASLHPALRPRAGGVRRRPGALVIGSLVFGALTLALAGKDLVGDTLFFGSQLYSLPLLATVWLGLATFRLAWRESFPSYFIQRVHTILPHQGLGPWEVAPAAMQPTALAPGPELPRFSFLLPIPFQPDLAPEPEWLTGFIEEAQTRLPGGEFLLIPFGSRMIERHPVLEAARALEHNNASVRVLPTPALPGRAAALRQGFLFSRGQVLLATHLEQPASAAFFAEALERIEAEGPRAPTGMLVRANRRLTESRFEVQVRLLSLVYGRHRMGLFFNRLVRAWLPIRTRDTHSGSWALTRGLASQVFALQTSADFLFDLELALVAHAFGAAEADLPATFKLREEKSWVRMFEETLAICGGLPILARRNRRGFYHPWPVPAPELTAVTADDWGLSPGVNEGILELARLGIVRRVSVMARGRYLEHRLDELKALVSQGKVVAGLHYDLTFGRSSAGKVLKRWLAARLRGGAARDRLVASAREELASQLAVLQSHGVSARYLDGHHHIHLVPGVLDALAAPLAEASIREVRLPYDRALWASAKAPLNLLSWLARPALSRHGFHSLPCFYPGAREYRDHGRLRARLVHHRASEIIVHPARVADLARLQIPDPYDDDRVTEFQALQMVRWTS